MTTSISGTAFTAVPTANIDRTNKELSQENISSLNDSKTEQTSNISYQTSHKLEDSSLVAFNDPTNDSIVLLSLSKNTISTLKSHFDKDDFYERDDGILRLDNKAEAYVSSWFGDIAYKREFLKSDSNNDGMLNDKEYDNTKNSFSHSGQVHGSGDSARISTQIEDKYQSSNNAQKIFINQMKDKSNINIDKQLDITLKNNTDFDDKVTFKEALVAHYNKGISSSIKQLADDMLGDKRANILDINFTQKLLEEMMKEASRQQDALQKLKVENGDITTLNKDEIKLLDGLLPDDKKIISDEDIDKISKNIENDIKIKETYKIEKSSNIEIIDLKG